MLGPLRREEWRPPLWPFGARPLPNAADFSSWADPVGVATIPAVFSQWLLADELTTWALFLELAVAGAIVVFAGAKLTHLADELADRLNMTGGWIGLVLLASVTSLPEVVTAGTATAIGNVDLAFAGIYGSCSFNITLIVLLNALIGGGSVLRLAGRSHTLTSSFGVLLMGISLMAIVLVEKFQGNLRVAQACEALFAVLILVSYVACMRLTYQFEKNELVESPDHTTRRPVGAALWSKLAIISGVLVAASWWLAQCGDVLSDHPIELIGRPLGATFVGAAFLAVATSLPEIVTSITAVRLGNLDLALGNLFGSNMFNIFVFPMLKAVSLARGDSLLMAGGAFSVTQNLIAGILPILLTAIAIGGLTYRSERKLLRRFGFDSVLIAVVYGVGMWLLLS